VIINLLFVDLFGTDSLCLPVFLLVPNDETVLSDSFLLLTLRLASGI
jgi:hypothetical protein